MRVRIEYGGEAVGAKDDFVPVISEKTELSNDESILQDESAKFDAITNPCELYLTALDGSSDLFENLIKRDIGIWSEQVSDDNGHFNEPIVLTATSDKYYSSSGITIEFDVANNIFARSINIKWYRDSELLSDENFYPNSSRYYCACKVDFYNKIVISFFETNMPRNRLKLHSIVYGTKMTFSGKDLKNIRVLQQIDPISTEILINTCDVELNLHDNFAYSFEREQKFKVFFDEQLIATQFIESANKKSKTEWSIKTGDYIGVLDEAIYHGGMYNDENAIDLLEDIFKKANVPYNIDDSFAAEKVTGYIPLTSCRGALLQVAFAIGATVDTSYSDVVSVKKIDNSNAKRVKLSTISDQSITDGERITGVEVVEHAYTESNETIELYDSLSGGQGDSIYLQFSEPCHDLSIKNGTIVSSGANFAIINAKDGCVLTGNKYNHTQSVRRKENPYILRTDFENIVSIKAATLVSKKNIDKVLELCYNYYTSGKIMSAKIIERRHDTTAGSIKDATLKLGDTIEVETLDGGTYKGVITRQSYSLNGNIIAKDTEVRQ